MQGKGKYIIEKVDIKELMELLIHAYNNNDETDIVFDVDNNYLNIEQPEDKYPDISPEPVRRQMFLIDEVPITDELLRVLMH